MDEFTKAYIECALWTDGKKHIHPETRAAMIADCKRFKLENAADIAAGSKMGNYSYDGKAYTQETRAGHDFWLTRNHHGCGFWDGDWPSGAADRLTVAAHEFGEFYV
jgi:hypothetical protein